MQCASPSKERASFCLPPVLRLRRRSSPTATTKAATELGSEVARGTTLLALASIASSVAALTVTSVTSVTVATATAAEPALATALLAHHATWGGVRPLLLDVCGRNDLGGEMEPLPEVVQTLRGERIVKVAPRVPGLDVASAVQRLHCFYDPEVLRLDGGVVDLVVLLGREHSLPEEGLKRTKC